MASWLLVASAAPPAAAWPDKPIRLHIGFQAGGTSDAIARYLGNELKQRLGVQVIIDNNPGNSGARALEAVATARDSHNFLIYSDEFLTVPLVDKTAKFRVLRDLSPIAQVTEGTYVLVAGPKAPFGSITEFVKHARANPGKMKFSSSGTGTMSHMIGDYLTTSLKLGMTFVPTRGDGGAVNELIDGNLHLVISGYAPVAQSIAQKQLFPLAITAATRDKTLPDVPTLDETIAKGIVIPRRYGIVGPKNLPDGVVDQLTKAIASVVEDPDLRRRLEANGLHPRFTDGKAYGEKLGVEEARWRKFIEKRRLGLN